MDNEAIAFGQWIADKLSKNSWFSYDGRFGTWYYPSKGHLTTKELYEVYLQDITINNS